MFAGDGQTSPDGINLDSNRRNAVAGGAAPAERYALGALVTSTSRNIAQCAKHKATLNPRRSLEAFTSCVRLVLDKVGICPNRGRILPVGARQPSRPVLALAVLREPYAGRRRRSARNPFRSLASYVPPKSGFTLQLDRHTKSGNFYQFQADCGTTFLGRCTGLPETPQLKNIGHG